MVKDGKPGVLQSMGSQSDTTEWLNRTDGDWGPPCHAVQPKINKRKIKYGLPWRLRQ